MTKIIDLPFDEPIDSAIAQDFSGNGNNFTLANGDHFGEGKIGNALYTRLFGTTALNSNAIVFTGDFTVKFWLNCGYRQDFPHVLTLYVYMSGLVTGSISTTQLLKFNLNNPAKNWTYVTITKAGNTLSLYADGVLMDSGSLAGYGTMQGFLFNKEYAGAIPVDGEWLMSEQFDDFAVLNGYALPPPEIIDEIINSTTKLAHFIDGIDFTTLGIYVEESSGVIDLPPRKASVGGDWKDEHGSVTDLKVPVFEQLPINLKCWFKAASREIAADKTAQIKDIFAKPGLIRFMFQGVTRYWPRDVQLVDGIEFEIPKWRDGSFLVRFELNMIDPQPIKKVLKHTRLGTSTKTAAIVMSTNGKRFNIYWGDGSVTPNVRGQGVSVNHDYATNGEYFINICGRAEQITGFSSNASTLWTILR